MAITLGIDIRQKRDPAAICVAKADFRKVVGRTEPHYIIRHLERLLLGTRYPRVAERVAEITSRVRVKTGEDPIAYLDATGVGQPVVDILRERLPGGWVVLLYFTHGDRWGRDERGRRSARQSRQGPHGLRAPGALQNHRLRLPHTREAEALTEELLGYEIRVDEDGRERSGAFRPGTHDDLVCALGLAVQIDPG